MRERTNEEWLAALRGPEREEAVADLRALIVRGLKAAFGGRVRGLETTTEDFAQDALIRVLGNLDSFRGESRFTTWAQKVAIRVAYTELRRRRWQDVSLQEIAEPATLADRTPTPERETARKTMVETLQHFISEELTERQRAALVAVMFEEMPLEEVARRMETNRNALYKLLHDARKKLKKRIEAEGLSPRDVLEALGEE
ncbi:DNA-directed RNA polymerase sigma-70 factor [Rubrobacter xylanophilus]|uniref:DNA-directed RNA polymerase sigma-70 factor n=1 Tax=Rubrobacter xylanophilus TaxID=49319 RepID=A0A510HFJ7_9ACTN|nr:sigma-70 family RNA polymerase sigma factor [Rubrobacter xylanophilus]BBL78732.1 DNA-directed RNA polymerase sigma-70 factor [Rubrobacter xylanophilus]